MNKPIEGSLAKKQSLKSFFVVLVVVWVGVWVFAVQYLGIALGSQIAGVLMIFFISSVFYARSRTKK